MADENPSLGAFGATFRGLFEQMASQSAHTESPLAKRLREHFGAAATEFPVIEEKFRWSDRPNLQVAIDAYLAVPSRSFNLVGISAGQVRFMMGIQCIDQAIEIPLPDRNCRRRLFELYGRGLTLRLTRLDSIVERTEGVNAAFIRELLRRSSLFAVDEGGEAVIEDRHVDEAMRELIVDGDVLTKSLLGALHLSAGHA